ncbi:serine protease [Vibrio plantisponsor]|uniref:Serine protease n=1 Tax=Vibrio plantisponsor TaxID=664643 RepID=A0ABU4IRI8_9VIBR|nr:serine protease [Vibrio plantisponsor]MDW6020070.1 serine protease [Vibrio plantisponsor]NNM40904.1 serine protease [Vibrio plantisponsor]PNH88167.1 serine protease [Vibrio diazotrophicus]
MKKKAVLLSSLIGMSCHLAASEDYQAYIVNGTNASITTFPSYVALFVDLIDYNNTYYEGSYCGGTILNSTHILTAAHCVYSSDPDNNLYSLFTTVVPDLQYESYFPNNITEKKRVAKIYYRDDYNSSTLNNDLAILQLESALTTINSSYYANRPSTGTTYRNASETFYAVGHGDVKTGVDDKDFLQKASLTYVDNSSCNYSNMTDTKLCMEGVVSPSNGLEASTCQGDSGGPLYWYSGSNYIQVGLTSFGPSTFCGDASSKFGATSVFTEVYDYRTWIDSVLAGTETAKYIATDTKRQSYVDRIGQESSSSGDSGGGAFGFMSLLFMTLLALVRRNAQ